MLERLREITAKYEELEQRMSLPEVYSDAEAYAEAADRILEGTLLSRPAAELAAACSCFGAAGCFFAVVEPRRFGPHHRAPGP